MTDPRALEQFVAVYRRGSFRAAADALGVSQSTVTKTIARLEGDLGVRLFSRTTRSVLPTDTARVLLSAAEGALAGLRSFEKEAALLAGGNWGTVRVGVIALAADLLIPEVLTRLSHTHPLLEVEVVVGSADVYQDLATGQCDIVIGDEANFLSSPHARGLKMQALMAEPLVVVHRRGHPVGQGTLADLLSFPWAIPSRYFNENHIFSALGGEVSRAQLEGRFPRYRLTSLVSCFDLAADSDVVTLAPRSAVLRAHRPETLVISNNSLNIAMKLVVVTVAQSAKSSSVAAFQGALADVPMRNQRAGKRDQAKKGSAK